jgi:hypothetical protein
MKALSLSESIPRIGTGNRRRMASSPSTTSDCSRATRGIASVQPEHTSVTTRLHKKVPCIDAPPWATKSTSRNPGAGSFQSANVRTGIWRLDFDACFRFLR